MHKKDHQYIQYQKTFRGGGSWQTFCLAGDTDFCSGHTN